MTVEVFDDRACTLGEGPLWHPMRRQLFWFDILGRRLLTRDADGPRAWDFDRHASAAGWVSERELIIATERDLILFDIETGRSTPLAPLEADTLGTRSNDGRADPWGGFWIGTMGKSAEAGAGALYRYYRGAVRRLAGDITIPNAICFAPDGGHAHFADTARQIVWRIPLDAEGWPDGDWHVFLDHRGTDTNPDGAVVDASGTLWCAEWGTSRVRAYDPAGRVVEDIRLPVPQPSCPAFGAAGLSTLFITTAQEGMSPLARAAAPLSGQTFAVPVTAKGQAEHRVIP